MTGRRPRTIREQTVDHSLAVLFLYARFSMRPLAYPQGADRVPGIRVFGPRASELIRICRVHPVPTGTSGTLTVAAGTVAPGRSPQRSGPSFQV